MSVTETLGRWMGVALAPAATLGSFLRRARLFHPDGVLYRADVSALVDEPLARALEGSALVRLSGALWRWPESATRPDILGVAVRLHPGEPRAQDLLFASFHSVLGLPLAVLTTDVRDFLANTYATVLPSRAPGLGRVDFRLDPAAIATIGVDRRERLEQAVAAGRAASPRALARLTLRERLQGGGDNLRFNPFHAGLGIEPTGFLQAIRAVAYPASQLGRAVSRVVATRRCTHIG